MKKELIILIIITIFLIIVITGTAIFLKNKDKNNTLKINNTINFNNTNTDTNSNKNENELEDFNLNNELNEYANKLNNEQDANITNNENQTTKEISKGSLYSEEKISDEEMIRKYLENYSFLAFNNVEESVNLLDSEFKAKFKNLNEYKNYINENEEYIYNLCTTPYENITTNTSDKNYIKIYTFYDNDGKKYTIKEKAIMQYTINIE